jgi:hypothetical protein
VPVTSWQFDSLIRKPKKKKKNNFCTFATSSLSCKTVNVNYKKTGSSCYQPESKKRRQSNGNSKCSFHRRRMKLHTISQNSSRNLLRRHYGRYIEDLKAYDAKGTLLTVKLILILGPFLKQRPLKNYLFSK